MNSVNGILKEEIARLKSAEQSYRKALAVLPKGSVSQKRIKGTSYPYLVFRKAQKVTSRYLGNLSAEQFKKLKDDIDLRRKYVARLREVRENLKKIHRMVYGKRKAV